MNASSRVLIWQAVIAGAVAIVIAFMQMQTKNAVAAVNTTIKASAASADVKLNDIHTLVNSNMGRQLKVAAVALRRVADMTRDKNDIAAALEAEFLLADHMKKQAAVDAGSGAKVQ